LTTAGSDKLKELSTLTDWRNMSVSRLEDLVGQEAPEFYTSVIAHLSTIREVAVAEYTPPPPVQARASLSKQEHTLVQEAAKSRRARISFLEILLEMSARANHPIEGIIDALAYHQSHSANRRWLSRREVLQGALVHQCASASAAKPLAFLSKVKTDSGPFRHIPMLDLHVEKSRRSLIMVQAIAQRLLDSPYAVLETARSYHMVGLSLLTGNQAARFLSRAVLFSPITDHAYIAHQLLERESALRITGRGGTNDVPTVVAIGLDAKGVKM